MSPPNSYQTKPYHILAIPSPGRGHINPLLSFCKSLSLQNPETHLEFTFVITEEWLSLIGSEPKPSNIEYATIPNVVPSEFVRGYDLKGFTNAVLTKMEGPVEELVDRIGEERKGKIRLIVADSYMLWAVGIGNRRGIPVASFWTMSATVFCMFSHLQDFISNRCYPIDLSAVPSLGGNIESLRPRLYDVVNVKSTGQMDLVNLVAISVGSAFFINEYTIYFVPGPAATSRDDRIDFIPGISSILLADIPNAFFKGHEDSMGLLQPLICSLNNAQYLLFRSIYELESDPIDTLKSQFPHLPIYPIGPAIPYFDLINNHRFSSSSTSTAHNNDAASADQKPNYLTWLDSQPQNSVLYVSLGSFFPVSSQQMDEIAAGLRDSGVLYLWVVRGGGGGGEEADYWKRKKDCGDRGFVVPWCEQLKVLSHPCVGGFFTHCGWNSTLESVFMGVPVLAFPLLMDQPANSKLMIEDWEIGWRVRDEGGNRGLVTGEEVSGMVKRFMDLGSKEREGLEINVRELKDKAWSAVAEGGSAEINLGAFSKSILELS